MSSRRRRRHAITTRASVPRPSHEYLLQNSKADVNGGAAIVSAGTLSANKITFTRGQGVSLPLSVLADPGNYTITFRCNIEDSLEAGDGFNKIIDSGQGIDNGVYQTRLDGTPGAEDAIDLILGVTEHLGGNWRARTTHRITVSRNGVTKLVKMYMDGELVCSATDTDDEMVFGAGGIRLFIDETPSGDDANESPAGWLNYLATYDRVLSDSQIALLRDSVSPEPDHDFLFRNSLNDRKGGVAITSHGGVLAENGYNFSGVLTNKGLSLAALGSSYSILVEASMEDPATASEFLFSAILDIFNGLPGDWGLYLMHDSVPDPVLILYGNTQTQGTHAWLGDEVRTMVVTRDSVSKVTKVYLNATLDINMTDTTDDFIWQDLYGIPFFTDTNADGDFARGRVSRISVWNRALSATEVAIT